MCSLVFQDQIVASPKMTPTPCKKIDEGQFMKAVDSPSRSLRLTLESCCSAVVLEGLPLIAAVGGVE